MITLDVEKRLIQMDISDDEIERRMAKFTPLPSRFQRGYGWMFSQHIEQAPDGCDFDFMKTDFGAAIGEPDIF